MVITKPLLTIFSGDCKSITQLASGASCTLNYTILAVPTDGNYTVSITGANLANSPLTLKVNIASNGDFDFFDGTDKLGQLDLYRGKQGSMTLHNTGGRDIGNVQLDFSAGLSLNDFPNNCIGHSLPKGGQCTINYNISNNTAPGDYTITARDTTGGAADKILNVNIANIGHFVFRNAANDNINSVSTLIGDKGQITLHNTGGQAITNVEFSFLKSGVTDPEFQSYFSGNCILRDHNDNILKITLPVDSSCELDYAIPYDTDKGDFTVEVQGTNIDNPGGKIVLPWVIRYPIVAVGSGGTTLRSRDGKTWVRKQYSG